MIDKFPVITICGSMRFASIMQEAAKELSLMSWIVLMPFVTFQPGEQLGNKDKQMLDRMHFAKIHLSDAICVVSDYSGYHGVSTQNEILHAKERGIAIMHWRESKLFRDIEWKREPFDETE